MSVVDKNGNEIKVGDLMLIPCTVVDVQDHEEHCNVTVETVFPVSEGHLSRFALNGSQMIDSGGVDIPIAPATATVGTVEMGTGAEVDTHNTESNPATVADVNAHDPVHEVPR